VSEPSLRRSAAIVGIAEMAPTRDHPDLREIDLMAGLAADAIADAGMAHDEVDGVLTSPPFGVPMMFPSMLSEYLGLRPRYADQVDLGGASAAGMVWRAAAAIAAGECETVVCTMASNMNPARFGRRLSPSERLALFGIDPNEAPFGPMGVNSAYAMAARRHMHDFGTTSAQLARIAVDQRTNALHNDMALFGDRPLTVEDVLSSRLVVDPLHLYEIVRPCSGGAAWVVTSPERAGGRSHRPAWLLGAAERVSHSSITFAPDITTTPVADTAPRAFAMAGVGPDDVDLVSVYDCYTIMVLLTLEDAGFCEKGRGGPFVEDTDMTFAGELPVNTHGGQLSFGQPGIAGGASHIIEAVRQLRGEADGRQVRDCEVAFVNGNGGTMSEEVSLVLGAA
jgi:acetyl-CoA acetyltransferase